MSEESKIVKEYEKASNPVKFSEEELKQVQEIRDSYSQVQIDFGQAAIQKIRIEQDARTLSEHMEQLQKTFVETQETEAEFLKNINKKYGEGELNPETGEFIPKSE